MPLTLGCLSVAGKVLNHDAQLWVEVYAGLGKGEINLEKLPVFAGTLGPFGSPTRDSKRAGITTESQEVLKIIVAFSASE